jgi:hypothetical protein
MILHFELLKNEPTLPSAPFDTLEFQEKLYTYVLPSNALYRGSTLIAANVVKSQVSPPLRE